MKRAASIGCNLIISYITAILFAKTFDFGMTQIDLILPCLMLLIYSIYNRAGKIATKSGRGELYLTLPFAALFSASVTVGSKMNVYDDVFEEWSLLDPVTFVFLTLFFHALLVILLSLLDRVDSMPGSAGKHNIQGRVDSMPESSENHKMLGRLKLRMPKMLLFFLIYVIAWMPYYLILFPGNLGADTFESMQMALGQIPLTNHHPVLFTLLIQAVLFLTSGLHSLTASMGIFTLLHMLAFAAGISVLTVFLWNRMRFFVGKLCTVLFFACSPVMGMYSIYISKDVLFSLLLVFVLLQLYKIVESGGELLQKKSFCVCLLLSFLLTAMLRNNGFYIMLIMAAVILFVYKKYWKQTVLIFVGCIALFLVWKGPVFSSLGIEKQSFAESVSIPLQQVGYVIWQNDNLEVTVGEEDRAFLEELMPLEEVKKVYDPGYTDPYKFDSHFNDAFLNEHKAEFIKVWAHLLPNHFSEYIKAYLMQTAGYWHYGETNSICTQGVSENVLGVTQTDLFEKVTGISFVPLVEKLVLIARKAPLLCMLTSMAMQMFTVYLVILQNHRNRRRQYNLVMIPLVVLWGTIMVATPAFCLLRYLFPVFLMWPLLLRELMAKRQDL